MPVQQCTPFTVRWGYTQAKPQSVSAFRYLLQRCVRSPLHVLVQNVHVDVRSGPEHVVRLMLSADSVQGATNEVGPLVRLRRGRSWASVALSCTRRFENDQMWRPTNARRVFSEESRLIAAPNTTPPCKSLYPDFGIVTPTVYCRFIITTSVQGQSFKGRRKVRTRRDSESDFHVFHYSSFLMSFRLVES